MPDLITVTGTVVDHDGGTALPGVTVTATPSRVVTRTSDGEDALTDASTTSDAAGAFSLALVWAAGLRYVISYRVGGRHVRPYVLDCDSWAAGSTVDVSALPPIAGVPPSAVEELQAWVLTQLALGVDEATLTAAIDDYLTANPPGIPDHNDTTLRDAADAHPMSAITGLVAELAGKQAAGSYATAAQGAKADTAVQPADLGPYATDLDLSGHASDTTAVHGIADTSALVLTTDPRLSDARTPTAHGHPISDVTNLQTTLDGKAAATHTHDVDDIDATGTADSTTYLRGDGTWAVPAGGGGGVTDHGALTGLGDDDHTQYALADGSRGSFAATSHTHTASQVSDSTATGRALLTATDAATARTAIGAGTSNFDGAYGSLSGTPTLGTAAAADAGDFAPALSADDNYVTDAEKAALHGHSNLTALDNVSGVNTGDQDLSGYALTSSLGTAAAADTTDFATAAQGALADTATQPGDLATVATTGAYSDLTGTPTIPDSPDDIGAAPATQAINAQTGTTYTLVAGDAGKLVTLDNAGAITLNAPGSVFTAGQRVDVLVLNTGMATVVGTSGASGNGTPSLVSRARYSAFTVVWLTATTFVVIGDMAAA